MANVLSIAGTDPSGGAGIQADLKTFAAFGVYGMAVTTAIVAQNTCGVRRVEVLNAGLVGDQLEAVLDDVRVDAVKVGMLGSAAVIRRVARVLRERSVATVVLDPVLCSSSGTCLLPSRAVAVMQRELLPLVTVLTPNLAEAAVLLSKPEAVDTASMEAAAQALLQQGPAWIWLKGGHLRTGAAPTFWPVRMGQAGWNRHESRVLSATAPVAPCRRHWRPAWPMLRCARRQRGPSSICFRPWLMPLNCRWGAGWDHCTMPLPLLPMTFRGGLAQESLAEQSCIGIAWNRFCPRTTGRTSGKGSGSPWGGPQGVGN